ncbi:MAG TPA: hypothetical protein VF650_07355 [Allosphingosinicella sp.]|jgi:hypothetical protein
MMGILLYAAAAANAPVQLAGRDEAQWRMFVRASLQRPAGARESRLRQLQGTVQDLADDRLDARIAGPSGL